MISNELKETIKQSKGKSGFIAIALGLTVREWNGIVRNNLELGDYISDVRETRAEALKNLASLNVEFAAISGEPWAIKEILSRKSASEKHLDSTDDTLRLYRKRLKVRNYVGVYDTYLDAYTYDILSLGAGVKIDDVCNIFEISMQELEEWRKDHKSFDKAVVEGLEAGLQSSKHRLMSTLVESGAEGNIPAIKEYLDRTEGKVQDKLELSDQASNTEMLKELAAMLPD